MGNQFAGPCHQVGVSGFPDMDVGYNLPHCLEVHLGLQDTNDLANIALDRYGNSHIWPRPVWEIYRPEIRVTLLRTL